MMPGWRPDFAALPVFYPMPEEELLSKERAEQNSTQRRRGAETQKDGKR
jgi:hypothetical protein